MPEIRQNFATREWVIIATERAKRPEEFSKKEGEPKAPKPEFAETCPFCPGNEDKTPPEKFRIDGDNSRSAVRQANWKVRVIPNKFAALSAEGSRERTYDGVNRRMSGVGVHEVIIETPLHNLCTATMTGDDVENVVVSYKSRYLEIMGDERIEHIVIFKNHGEAAGTSLEHPHSQVIGVPLVPSHIRDRLLEAQRYFDDHGECAFCKMLEFELDAGERIILDTEHFVTFIPYAALSPFHTWILPKRHSACFADISGSEIRDLARSLRSIIAKMFRGLDDPDFNYVIRSIPTDITKADYFHWYLSIVPRVTKTAGFELGSGMFINVALPEESANFLRKVEIA